jgi:lipoprotein LprG
MMRRILLAVLACAAAAATACSSDEPAGDLPDGAGLLKDSAATTAKIESAHFTLAVNGDIEGLDVRSAEGDLTREGDDGGAAKGTVSMTLLGQLFEGEFVLIGDKVWIKGPTGDHQELPASMVANLYDPAAILDPERGVANVLSNVQNPVTEGTEDIDGEATYRVKGKAERDVVANLVPGIDSDVTITFWVLQEDGHQPLKASVAVPGDGDPTVDVTLTDVGKQVDITPPV